MPERLVLDRAAPSSDDVVKLGVNALDAMNGLYEAAHRGAGSRARNGRDADLRRAFADVQRSLSDAPPAEPGRLKRSLLGPYFRWTGVDGMINPFGLEVLANPDLLPFERPFVAAHEWGHLAGYADESEANFVGWLTCVRASPAAQYSGWFYLYWQISGEVNARERARLNAALADGPRARHQRGDCAAAARRGARPAACKLEGVRPVSESEPCRGGRAQLRRGREPHSSRPVRERVDAGSPGGVVFARPLTF